ncbi:Uncharacterised protein [Enterobacter cloacae]|uniref:SnoaL-like domain-containing protein n=1 Tax=Enterobacter cloacae TaxID=550 RepID=A0A377LVX8_ENTCL|nr:Uncharacterised protein [Enterobacter cloacae]
MSIITSLIADTDNAAQREKMACLLTRLFNGDIDPAEVFTPDYQQVTDGHTLDYRGFIQHLSHVRSQTRTIAFTVAEIACHDELLADRHIVTVTYPGGRQAEIEVYLFAALREGKSGGSMKSRGPSAAMLQIARWPMRQSNVTPPGAVRYGYIPQHNAQIFR